MITKQTDYRIDAAVDAELKLGGRLAGAQIVASNDINEDVLLALNREGHEIDTFGIGTHLVPCQKQPALGCVYKLVEINGNPRIKLSAELEKLVIPCKKRVYRLFGADGVPLIDVMTTVDEEAPTGMPCSRFIAGLFVLPHIQIYVMRSRQEDAVSAPLPGEQARQRDAFACSGAAARHMGREGGTIYTAP